MHESRTYNKNKSAVIAPIHNTNEVKNPITDITGRVVNF